LVLVKWAEPVFHSRDLERCEAIAVLLNLTSAERAVEELRPKLGAGRGGLEEPPVRPRKCGSLSRFQCDTSLGGHKQASKHREPEPQQAAKAPQADED